MYTLNGRDRGIMQDTAQRVRARGGSRRPPPSRPRLAPPSTTGDDNDPFVIAELATALQATDTVANLTEAGGDAVLIGGGVSVPPTEAANVFGLEADAGQRVLVSPLLAVPWAPGASYSAGDFVTATIVGMTQSRLYVAPEDLVSGPEFTTTEAARWFDLGEAPAVTWLVAAVFGGEGGPDHPLVRIVSDGGSGLQFTGIAGLKEPTDDAAAAPFQYARLPEFKQDLPTEEEPFAILLEPLAAGTEGEPASALAAVSGAVYCLVDIKDVEHRHADCEDENPAFLVSGETGRAEIIWAQNQSLPSGFSEGVQLCLVLLSGGGGGGGGGAKMVAITQSVNGGVFSSADYTLSPDSSGPFDCPLMELQDNGTWRWDESTTIPCEATFTTGLTVPLGRARLAVVVDVDGAWVIANADCGEVTWP